MSHLWPHPAYAEDQPHALAILTTHVLYRGFQTGAIVGPLVGAARHYALPLVFSRKAVPSSSSSPAPPSASIARTRPRPPLLLLRSTGTGAVWGLAIGAAMVPGRMWGRGEIEWKDRAWRLLENKGQVEVDGWGAVGVALGGVGVGVLGRRSGWSWRMRVGGLGMGSTVGVLGYMVWRHGVNGGKWEEAVPDIEGVTT